MKDVARPFFTLLGYRTLFRRARLATMINGIENKSVIDICCGEGGIIARLAEYDKTKIGGLDIFRPSLDKAMRLDVYRGLVQGHALFLPFKDKCTDIAVSIAALEHLSKEDGIRLVEEMTRIARKVVVVSCPVVRWEQDPLDGNPYQKHLYHWTIPELREMGFQDMVGVGLRGMSGRIWGSLLRTYVSPVLGLMTLLATVISYRIPRIASNVVAWKVCE